METFTDGNKTIVVKNYIAYTLAVICVFAGLTACFIGLYMDPEGIIDTSLLYFYGVSLAFAGGILGISIWRGDHKLNPFGSSTRLR